MKPLRNIVLLFTVLFAVGSLLAQPRVPERPSPPKLVNNFSVQFPDFFSASEESMLEYNLVKFESETSNQIVVVVVDSLGGYDANAFATEIGHKWGVGQDKFDNGIVVLIKPTGGEGDRDAYIAVGYGLEGVITDITATQIVEHEMLPEFQKGKFYNGVDKAVTRLMEFARGEITAPEYSKSVEKNYNAAGFLIWLLPLIFAILILLFMLKVRKAHSRTIGRGGYTRHPQSGSSYSNSSSNSWSSSSSSSSYSSGSSSRSLGGYGGGGFGGGGGGGKW